MFTSGEIVLSAGGSPAKELVPEAVSVSTMQTTTKDEKTIPDINKDSTTYFLLTSLTSGQSSVVTATSRLEHLLTVHKVPFVALDTATHEKARSLWKRRGNGKRLPVVVHDGVVLGNFDDLEQWNEYGELKQRLGIPEAPRPVSFTRKSSVASLASISTAKSATTTTSVKPSGHPLPPNDLVREETLGNTGALPITFIQAVTEAAALATEKKNSGAFTLASSKSSIMSVESATPSVKSRAPSVSSVKSSASTVKQAASTTLASKLRNRRSAVPAAAKRASRVAEMPLSKTAAKNAIKASGRAPTDTSRPTSRASTRPESRSSLRPESRVSIRPESRISVRPDSKAAKRTTMTSTKDKAPSITAKSVKSTSSASTVKPTGKEAKKNGKKDKAKIDKLKKEEVK
ncbi:hypothetical protein BDZ91DRAFT_760052 [Kalaharituber pfeilii]|nr:hypothetical protein BDZ91DRAFT_760052 [Kalaharituber pfeilii]